MRQPLPVRYAVEARSELDAIFRYIAEQNPVAASDVVEAVTDAVRMIAEYPRMGRRTCEGGAKVVALSRYPYLIFFKARRDHVQILHIRHGARRHPGFQEEAAASVA